MRNHIIVCPHCSQLFADHRRLTAGAFSYSATEGFSVRDIPLIKGNRLSELVGTVMEARGDTVTDVELARILESRAADVSGLIAVQIAKLKRRIVDADAEWPLRRVRGSGWRWSGPPVDVTERHLPHEAPATPTH